MKLLLLVGSANDIFIYNYAKWLKSRIDVIIDVFEFYPSNQQGFRYDYYNIVSSAGECHIPKVRAFVDPFIKSNDLSKFLKGRFYDIIHCHWVTSPVVLTSDIKKYCRKFVITFWGGELEEQRILLSKSLYRYQLNKLSHVVDCVINTNVDIIPQRLPDYKGLCRKGYLGSAPIESIYSLMQNETREQSKIQMHIPPKKYVVQLGYSGKSIHRHIDIIRELKKYPHLKSEIHLLAPMTRGANADYIEEVKREIESSGFSGTVISGGFLSDLDIGRIRNLTDIVLQLSEWDGFSRSIVECFCAKSVVIYGSWLNYDDYLKASGFEGVEVASIEEGVQKVAYVVANFSVFRIMTERNFMNGKTLASWSECINDWVNAYHELLITKDNT